MKKNTRKNLISTLIFILLFALFQLWGNSRADIGHAIGQSTFWVKVLIAGTIYCLGLSYLPIIFRRK
ncbi:TPA: hypothetical protein ACIRI2_000407 [Streptococcus suis]|uniref:Uncharacterized protein n=2 Tax=Streptococcus suis TaxID=1307 RepID=A0AAJ2PIW0_STRSU|nr:hypothetical protein [Streptococcus suis]ASW50195.1 hypothetical protein A7J08_07890 [Streptococcus suis]KPA73017.1 membrane protein [Streptococcus suis]MDW8645964.1 hypothetical protein [Streptococcus suis]NQM46210.1 hypothetical protein [Streptococcus suis]HEL1675039.1 hypothetical protein [Streptococcus suis]